MKEVFFANIWSELLSIQFLEMLEKEKYLPVGNWLLGKRHKARPDSKTKLIVYSPVSSGGVFVNSQLAIKIPTIFLAAYPDFLMGWDFKRNTYMHKKRKEIGNIIRVTKENCAVSNYVGDLMNSIYKKPFRTIYWGLPLKEMKKTKNIRFNGNIKVLWNHMWRLDKGFSVALDIIEELAGLYPHVQFVIGRKERWANDKYSPDWLKEKYKKFRDNKLSNIFFENSFKVDDDKWGQKRYWKFLKSFDIAFSTSFHEGLGLGMLEQAASSIACIVPNTEVYPEVYLRKCLVKANPKSIKERIIELIENKAEREKCRQDSFLSVSKFSIEKTCASYLELFSKYII